MATKPEEFSPQFYDSLGISYETAFGHDPGLHKFIQQILSQLPPKSNVLDNGCGTGRPVASAFANAGHNVTGIDISSEMIKLSRVAVPSATFHVTDMQSFDPPAGTRYAAIISSFSLFPLEREEIEAQISKWSSWLAQDGVLAIAYIAAEDVDGKGGKYDEDVLCAREILLHFMGHDTTFSAFTREGWKSLLTRNGLEIVDSRTELFVPPQEADSEPEPHLYLLAKKAK